jgi:hypothetical protein
MHGSCRNARAKRHAAIMRLDLRWRELMKLHYFLRLLSFFKRRSACFRLAIAISHSINALSSRM